VYKKILVPLDGSNEAEQVLPYARFFGEGLQIPVELTAVIDIATLTPQVSPDKARYVDTLAAEASRHSEEYLNAIAQTFLAPGVRCTIEKGRAAEVIIEKAAEDKGTLITMATHGRSGLDRWLLGSVAEKILHGTANPLLLIRVSAHAKTERKASVKSIVVPLDGSDLAESVLPTVVEMAKQLNIEIILFRACNVPYSFYGGIASYSAIVNELLGGIKAEARDYLEKKTEKLKNQGVTKVSYVLHEGIGADEIISMARKTPDNLIAMCTHGWSGVKRWVLGNVTATVVRHSSDPVLILRAS
jgi:nucleotide-binding universal stress UspA family protein